MVNEMHCDICKKETNTVTVMRWRIEAGSYLASMCRDCYGVMKQIEEQEVTLADCMCLVAKCTESINDN